MLCFAPPSSPFPPSHFSPPPPPPSLKEHFKPRRWPAVHISLVPALAAMLRQGSGCSTRGCAPNPCSRPAASESSAVCRVRLVTWSRRSVCVAVVAIAVTCMRQLFRLCLRPSQLKLLQDALHARVLVKPMCKGSGVLRHRATWRASSCRSATSWPSPTACMPSTACRRGHRPPSSHPSPVRPRTVLRPPAMPPGSPSCQRPHPAEVGTQVW